MIESELSISESAILIVLFSVVDEILIGSSIMLLSLSVNIPFATLMNGDLLPSCLIEEAS